MIVFNNQMTSGYLQVRNDDNAWFQPQMVSNSYYWSNRTTAGAASIALLAQGDCTNCVAPGPRANVDVFFDSMGGGVGCGPLSGRPATCSPGFAYWATDQSCTNLSGMVGRAPATPISGTLYKCTGTNTWTAYFTPLAYPHPLAVGQ
jgi:hypothetical protein